MRCSILESDSMKALFMIETFKKLRQGKGKYKEDQQLFRNEGMKTWSIMMTMNRKSTWCINGSGETGVEEVKNSNKWV